MKFILLGLMLSLALVARVTAQEATTEPMVVEGAVLIVVPPMPEELAPVNPAPEDTAEGLQILQAVGIDPQSFLWERRIVAVMADTPNDPAFARQLRDIMERPGVLFERDVVVIIDSDRASGSALRQMLRPRGFMLAIIGKDGEIKQRRPAPRDVREISAAIDHFPLRRQEILERLPAGR